MRRADERAEAIAEVMARLKNYSLSPCLDCGGQGYGDQGKSACFWCRGAGVITQQMAHAFGISDRATACATNEHPETEKKCWAKPCAGERAGALKPCPEEPEHLCCYPACNCALERMSDDLMEPARRAAADVINRFIMPLYARINDLEPPSEAKITDPVLYERAKCAYLAETHTGMWDNATAEAIASAIRERGTELDDTVLVFKDAWAKVQPIWMLLRHGVPLPADLAQAIDAQRAETEGLGAKHESAVGEAEAP